MELCNKCGSVLDSNSNVCSYCGVHRSNFYRDIMDTSFLPQENSEKSMLLELQEIRKLLEKLVNDKR